MFFPVDPVVAIQGRSSLSLQLVNALAIQDAQSNTSFNATGVFGLSAGLNIVNIAAGLSINGLTSGSGITQAKIYNRGNPVNLVNLSGLVPMNQRMILPSGMTTVLGNNQWAEVFFDGAGGSWRILL